MLLILGGYSEQGAHDWVICLTRAVQFSYTFAQHVLCYHLIQVPWAEVNSLNLLPAGHRKAER